MWLDNEVLYREGLALQVDKGDPAIRERVIFKALSLTGPPLPVFFGGSSFFSIASASRKESKNRVVPAAAVNSGLPIV